MLKDINIKVFPGSTNGWQDGKSVKVPEIIICPNCNYNIADNDFIV